MIQKIRRKFIVIAVAVLSAAMITLTVVINAANWINVRTELQETLADLAEGGGERMQGSGRRSRTRQRQNNLAESRFFLVRLTDGNEYVVTDSTRLSDAVPEDLNQIVGKAMASGRNTGMAGSYMYRIDGGGNGRGSAVFLNCETKLESVRRLLLISGIACAGGILAALLLVMLFSRRAIQPLIRNAIQQKQFITDAGHELKTPLTVISANMDALELNCEGNEWISSTRRQIANMRTLVNDMIYLSRMDEDGALSDRVPLNLSELVRQETEPFLSMAEFVGKTLETEIEEGLYISGDSGALARLIRQLCDNAVKYAPEGDAIRISLARDGRNLRLTEKNALAEPMTEETLTHLFDRFYRPDASRSRESGGYGIGLSMVRAIAEKHNGKIRAERTGDGGIRFVCMLPAFRPVPGRA